MVLRLGANHVPAPPFLRGLAHHVGLSLLVPSKTRSWASLVRADGDPRGNDRYGCCCQVADLLRVAWTQAAGGSIWLPSTDMVLGRYQKITGFNPVTGLPDDGTDTCKDMTDWSTSGIDLAPLQFVDIPNWCPVDPANDNHVALAIDRFGPVLITLNLPAAWEDISGWSKPPGTGPSWVPGSGGGHRVLGIGYEEVSGPKILRTWGMDIVLHPKWWKQYVIAVDAVPTLAWFRAQPDLTVPGTDWDEMAADMRSLAAA